MDSALNRFHGKGFDFQTSSLCSLTSKGEQLSLLPYHRPESSKKWPWNPEPETRLFLLIGFCQALCHRGSLTREGSITCSWEKWLSLEISWHLRGCSYGCRWHVRFAVSFSVTWDYSSEASDILAQEIFLQPSTSKYHILGWHVLSPNHESGVEITGSFIYVLKIHFFSLFLFQFRNNLITFLPSLSSLQTFPYISFPLSFKFMTSFNKLFACIYMYIHIYF